MATDTQLINEAFLAALETKGMEKHAEEGLQDFTRTKMREAGFTRKLVTFEPIANDRLVRRLDTDKPYMIVDKETDSPASITVPFGGGLPASLYIRASRYPVPFNRIETIRYIKDVAELRTYHMDIRQVLSDNTVKDIGAEEDDNYITSVDTMLFAPDTPVPYSGAIQWQTLLGGWNRDNLEEAFAIMPKTPSRLEVNTCLTNSVSIRQILKWGRDEIGGDKSQDFLVNGWAEAEFMRAKWVITIKRDIIPDDALYMFSHEKFIGKAYELEPPTMVLKREAYMLEFWTYEEVGGAIGHGGGLARADFA